MKGLVYGGSEYWTVLEQTAESGGTGHLSSRTSAVTQRTFEERAPRVGLAVQQYHCNSPGKKKKKAWWCHYISSQIPGKTRHDTKWPRWKFIKFHWWLSQASLITLANWERCNNCIASPGRLSDDPTFNGCLRRLMPGKVAANDLRK